MEDGSQMRVPINTLDADLSLSYDSEGMVNLMLNDVSVAGEVAAGDHGFFSNTTSAKKCFGGNAVRKETVSIQFVTWFS